MAPQSAMIVRCKAAVRWFSRRRRGPMEARQLSGVSPPVGARIAKEMGPFKKIETMQTCEGATVDRMYELTEGPLAAAGYEFKMFTEECYVNGEEVKRFDETLDIYQDPGARASAMSLVKYNQLDREGLLDHAHKQYDKLPMVLGIGGLVTPYLTVKILLTYGKKNEPELTRYVTFVVVDIPEEFPDILMGRMDLIRFNFMFPIEEWKLTEVKERLRENGGKYLIHGLGLDDNRTYNICTQKSGAIRPYFSSGSGSDKNDTRDPRYDKAGTEKLKAEKEKAENKAENESSNENNSNGGGTGK